MTERHPGWLTAQTPAPKRTTPVGLGQDAFSARTGKPKPMPRAIVEAGARAAQHGGCVDHVEITGGGSSQTVCILRGQDPARVVAEARELMGGEE